MALSFDSVSMEVKVRNKSSTACLPWWFPGLFLQCVAWAEFPHLQGQQCLGRPAGNKGKPPDLGGWAPSVALRLLWPATPIANGCQCSPSCFCFMWKMMMNQRILVYLASNKTLGASVVDEVSTDRRLPRAALAGWSAFSKRTEGAGPQRYGRLWGWGLKV